MVILGGHSGRLCKDLEVYKGSVMLHMGNFCDGYWSQKMKYYYMTKVLVKSYSTLVPVVPCFSKCDGISYLA